MTLLVAMALAQPDPVASTLWYAKETNTKVDELAKEIKQLVAHSIEDRGEVRRLGERVTKIEADQAASKEWIDNMSGRIWMFIALFGSSVPVVARLTGREYHKKNREEAIRMKQEGRG